MADPTPVVYACRNDQGDIIYIGSTVRFEKRMLNHRYESPWWHEVADVQQFPMPDEATAREREKDAIASVRPDYNTLGVNRDRTGVMAGTTGKRRGSTRLQRRSQL